MLHLVTGGSGYLGSAFVEKLLKRGDRVRVFDLIRSSDFGSEVEFIQGDIRDKTAVSRSTQGVDYVFHNVAQVPLAKDKELFLSVNRDGTENILDASLQAKVKKVVYTSSSAVYGIPRSNPVTTQMVPEPMEAYGRAKYDGEKLCHVYAAKGLDVSILRPRTILGHGRLGIFQILFEWISQGYNIPVLGNGDNVYQFVHSDDFVRAAIAAAEKPGCSVFNCGAERFGTMRESLQSLCDYAKTGSKVVGLPQWPVEVGMKLTSSLGLSPLGPYHALMYGRSMYFDIGDLKRDLGWSPKYSNVEMLIESYDWYLAHRSQLTSDDSHSHHRSAVKQGVLSLVKRLL